MLDLLVEWVFKLVVSFFTILMTPLYRFLTFTIPQFPTYVQKIIDFLVFALNYVPRILDLLFIPRACFQIWFSYIVIKYSIIITVKIIKFVIKVYNALKP